jgi:hypothetical protein
VQPAQLPPVRTAVVPAPARCQGAAPRKAPVAAEVDVNVGGEPRINAAIAQAAPAQTPPARTVEYVEEKGFKGKIFDIKYRDPDGLRRVILPLASGFKGAAISVDPGMKTMTVRDFPENIAAIEEAIKRLDTPEAPRPDIEFAVHILLASNAPLPSTDVPAELGEVIKQLQTALRYKNYGLMTSGLHRAKEGPSGINNTGVAESKLFAVPKPNDASPTFYEYALENISLDNRSGSAVVNVGQLRFNMRIPVAWESVANPKISYENVGFRSPVALKQGEKVVVGSTTMGDKGLIVVISARVIK